VGLSRAGGVAPKDDMKKKKGRKSLFTEVREQLLSLLRFGHTIRNACAAVGISERVFYEWCEKNAAFSAEVTRARAAGRVQIVERILKSPDWRALSWYLERTDPEQYGRVAERQLAVSAQPPVELPELHIIVKGISEEDRTAAAELMGHSEPPPVKKQNAPIGSNGNGRFEFS
jgi:hypothetical protein